MAAEEAVSGDGWISDDSSFYGDERGQEQQESLYYQTTFQEYWRSRKTDLNVLLIPSKHQHRKALPVFSAASITGDSSLPQSGQATDLAITNSTPVNKSSGASNFLPDRRIMEEARLARSGKRVREPCPEQTPFNPGQGRDDAWQLGESTDEFFKRLPPLRTSALSFPWIWAHDPHQDSRSRAVNPDVGGLTARGALLLEESSLRRRNIEQSARHGPISTMTKLLKDESKALQQRIANLAADCEVIYGKWMLFLAQEVVTSVWKQVVEGVITSRLGPTAKVATDDGNPGDRLICIYTKDFSDEDDVARVLEQMERMGLLKAGRTIYYKSDAYTYLNLYKDSAAAYGLQASLYNSFTMMNATRLAQASGPQKKQTKLNSYF